MIYDRPAKIYTGRLIAGDKCYFCEKKLYDKVKREQPSEKEFYRMKQEMIDKNMSQEAMMIEFRGAKIFVCKDCLIEALQELDSNLVVETKEEAEALSKLISSFPEDKPVEDQKSTKGKAKNGK